MKLAEIQSKIKAPKGQFNAFGKYKYRSCEDLVEAIKPVVNGLNFALILSDEIVEIGGRIYFKATAKITDGTTEFQAVGYAREEESKKGMDASQLSGATSSYARKYALNGLFAIDDTKDADATNEHKDEQKEVKKEVFNEKHTKFIGALKAIQEGKYTLDELKSYYDVSETTINLIKTKLN